MVAEHSFRGSSMSVGSGHHTWSRAGSSDNYLTGSDGDDSSNVEEWPAVRLKSVVVPVSNTQWGVVESRDLPWVGFSHPGFTPPAPNSDGYHTLVCAQHRQQK